MTSKDEKEWNSDGPIKYHLHNLRKEPNTCSSRQVRWNICDAFGFIGQIFLAFFRLKQEVKWTTPKTCQQQFNCISKLVGNPDTVF